MTAGTSDADLVRAARDGDRRAFGLLYEGYARVVHGVLLARVPRAHVDDLVQDAFVRALERLHTLRDPQAFGGWLIAIARRCAADHLRRARATVEVPEDLASYDPPGAEAREALEAVRALPEAYRETLVLRLVEGMTGPEIARRTGLTEGSVRVNLHRGMRMLRERLGLADRRGSARPEPGAGGDAVSSDRSPGRGERPGHETGSGGGLASPGRGGSNDG